MTDKSHFNFKRSFWLPVGDRPESEAGSHPSALQTPRPPVWVPPILASSFLNPHSAHQEIPLALSLKCILNPPTSLPGHPGLPTFTSHLDNYSNLFSVFPRCPQNLCPCEHPSWVTFLLHGPRLTQGKSQSLIVVP